MSLIIRRHPAGPVVRYDLTVARNVPDPSQRRTPSRVTKSPVASEASPTWAKKGRDRRQFWIRFMVAFLVLAMILPVIAAFF